ncbi:MAG: hypothetical protein HY512_04370 [Candidatus Aenigmarchaeota archaeon]|nr:hypothetical protein [Candidatus Aenigmarchaeota archaeon]
MKSSSSILVSAIVVLVSLSVLGYSQQSNLTTPSSQPTVPTTSACGDDWCQNLAVSGQTNELDTCQQDCGSSFTAPLALQNAGITGLAKIGGVQYDPSSGDLTFAIEFIEGTSLSDLGIQVWQSSTGLLYTETLPNLGLIGSVVSGDTEQVKLSFTGFNCDEEIKIGIDQNNPSNLEGTILVLSVDKLPCGQISSTPPLYPPTGQPNPPANLQKGWNLDQSGDAWLVIEVEQGLNLLSSIFTSAGVQHPSSTIDPTTDFRVLWLLDPLQQTFVDCYPGVSPQNQPQDCIDFSDRMSTDPRYQNYALSLGGFAESTKSGQLIYYFPSYSIQQLKDPTFLKQVFSMTNFVDGYNLLFTGPWFEGLTLDDVSGSCTYGNIYGWDAMKQDWTGPLSQMSAIQAQQTDIGTTGLVEVSGDCTLAYPGTVSGGRPTLPPRSSGIAVPTVTVQPIQGPDLVVDSVSVSTAVYTDLQILVNVRNDGNQDADIPDMEVDYAGMQKLFGGGQTTIIGGGSGLINAGSTETLQYLLPYDPTAKTITLGADPNDVILELDETNNVYQYIINGISGDPCTYNGDCLSQYCTSNRVCS